MAPMRHYHGPVERPGPVGSRLRALPRDLARRTTLRVRPVHRFAKPKGGLEHASPKDDMKTLHISSTLSLPLDALMKRHFIVGQSSSGKTSDAVVMFEEYSKANQQVVVLDSTGVWWGLRSSLDGKGDGLPVFVLGGEHGDMPLEPTAGAIVAEFVVKSGHSFVLDLSLMRKSQASLFVMEFADRLYDAKAQDHSPLHLMVDEADLYAPETPTEAKIGKPLFEAMDNIARRGRSRGLASTWITQRPQVISKSIISQADVLHVFRLSHPLDRGALNGWVRGNATKEEITTFETEITQLEMGDCFIWSPQWLKLFKRIHIRQRETFDSSATPEVGAIAAKPKVFTKVDVADLQSQILSTIEVAKAEDPAFLRARIGELEKKLKDRPPKPSVPKMLRDAIADAARGARGLSDALGAALAEADSAGFLDEFAPTATPPAKASPRHEPLIVKSSTLIRQEVAAPRRAAPVATNGAIKLRAGERRILEVLARHHPTKLTRSQLGALTGIKGGGSTMGTYRGVLVRHGLIDVAGELVALTSTGLAMTGSAKRKPMTRAEIVDIWKSALRAGERNMLDAIISTGEMTRDELGEVAGIDPEGSTFGTYLGVLKRNELVLVDGSKVRLGDALSRASR